jgi:G3E family GTPase
MYDTFVIWPHGQEKLTEFLKHLNGFQTNIQFTMEKEGLPPFLDIDIYSKLDGSLGHKVYRRTTHSNLYLHRDSHHHPANEQSVLASLTHTAKALCDHDSLTQVLEFLTSILQKMVTTPSRYDEPLNLQHGPPRPTKDPPRLHSYLTSRQHMAGSAECWPNTTSKVSLYHQGKYTATFQLPRMH